jgi:Domain of unknown function (DUF4917)
VAPIAIDGSLKAWDDVAQEHAWSALLLGNGLSINVWPRFAYSSLFDNARAGGLTDADRALFDGTRNFERALNDLMTAMRVSGVLGLDTQPILARYRSIQVALGHAIRAVHLSRSRIPKAMLPGSKREIAARQAEVLGRLEAESVSFFDARTHPLGVPSLVAR